LEQKKPIPIDWATQQTAELQVASQLLIFKPDNCISTDATASVPANSGSQAIIGARNENKPAQSSVPLRTPTITEMDGK